MSECRSHSQPDKPTDDLLPPSPALLKISLSDGRTHQSPSPPPSQPFSPSMAKATSVDYGSVSRSDFPPDFVFGVATSAYEVEGASGEGNRGPSIWDAFSNTQGNCHRPPVSALFSCFLYFDSDFIDLLFFFFFFCQADL